MNIVKGADDMKKLFVVLLLIGFVVMMTWCDGDKQKQKEYNVQQIEENLNDYLD